MYDSTARLQELGIKQEEVLQALGWKYLQRDRGTFQPDTFCLHFATTLRQGLCVSSHAVFCFPSARP